MTKQEYAERVAIEAGMGIVEVLALLSALWPLIQKLPCFNRRKVVLMKSIDSSHRECCRKRSCPYRLRRTIQNHGQTPSEFWYAMNKVAFAHHEAVATMMLAM